MPASDLANAALHHPVMVSSVLPANPGAAAVDGDAGSGWTSLATDPQWLVVDFGLTKDLSRVRLRWNTNYASSYTLQLSTDGTNWAGIYSTSAGGGGAEDVLVAGRGRYLSRNHAVAILATVGKSLRVYDKSRKSNRRIGSPNSDRVH